MNRNPDSKAARKEDAIISDSDDLSDIACDICDLEFPSVKAYESHLKGRKHHKMVSKMKLRRKARELGAADQDGSKGQDVNDEDEVNCEICDKTCNGYVSYVAHLKGSVHKKNAKKQKMKNKLKDMPEVFHKENNESDSDEDGILPKTYAKCSTCSKVFYGPEPFQQHLKGSSHKRKLQQQKFVENLKTKLSLNGENDEDDESEAFSRCETCGKSFSGPIPYTIHMESSVHKKEVERAEIAKEIKGFCLEDSDGSKYVCKECKKPFNDPVVFKRHLTNNDHEKDKVRGQISNLLSTYPEMLMVKPDRNSDSEEGEESFNSFENDSFWVCKLCHVSFSGPENAHEHIKSKKHTAVKTELRKRKLIKTNKDKSNSSVSSPVKAMDASTKISLSDRPLKMAETDTAINSHEDFEMI